MPAGPQKVRLDNALTAFGQVLTCMDGGDIPTGPICGGERCSHFCVQRGGAWLDADVADDAIVLSAAEVRSLAEFFLLLDRWDRIGTTVAEQATAPEITAA